MKLSFMTFMCPEYSLDQVISEAERFGYDGVEPRVSSGHKHGIEPEATSARRREIREAFADSRIEIACIATSCTFATKDAAQRQKNIEELKRQIGLAHDLGAPGIRVFGGVRKQPMTMDEAIAIVAEDISKASEFARESDVEIWLETHDDFSLAASVSKVVDKVQHPSLGVNWDLMHPLTHGEPLPQTWGYLKGGKVRHTHVHDFVKEGKDFKLCAIGKGLLPLSEQLNFLKSEGYAGYLSAEYWTELRSPQESLASYIKAMRSVLKDI